MTETKPLTRAESEKLPYSDSDLAKSLDRITDWVKNWDTQALKTLSRRLEEAQRAGESHLVAKLLHDNMQDRRELMFRAAKEKEALAEKDEEINRLSRIVGALNLKIADLHIALNEWARMSFLRRLLFAFRGW